MRFSEFAEFSESSAPFRENAIEICKLRPQIFAWITENLVCLFGGSLGPTIQRFYINAFAEKIFVKI